MVEDSRQIGALVLVVVFTVIGGIAVALRLWSVYLSRQRILSGKHLVTVFDWQLCSSCVANFELLSV